MIYFLVFTNFLFLSGLIILVRRHLEILERFDDLNERVEESLDILDKNYTRLSNLLETPVLLDDPIAVEMVQTARAARDSMLVVANIVTEQNVED